MVGMSELKELLEGLSPEQRAKSKACAEKIMQLLSDYGEMGMIALAVVGVAIEIIIDKEDI
jgi:hypothetical protein